MLTLTYEYELRITVEQEAFFFVQIIANILEKLRRPAKGVAVALPWRQKILANYSGNLLAITGEVGSGECQRCES